MSVFFQLCQLEGEDEYVTSVKWAEEGGYEQPAFGLGGADHTGP